MSAVQPVAVYALRVPPGAMVPAVPNAAASFRVSMAAIDPDEEPEFEDGDSSKPARATLKIVRPPPGLDMDDSDDEDYSDEEDDEDDSDDEEVNGGPSDKEKARKLKQAAAQKELEEAMEEDDDEDEDDGGFDLKAAISKLIKGKGPATDDDESDDESDEGLDLDESVICTLSADKNCQQPLDITVCEGERVFFKNTGSQTVFLTGNYVIGLDEGHPDEYDEDEEDDYDLSPDEDELDMDAIMAMDDDESDDLDGMDDPRITEVDSEEEAPKLVQAKGKGKNKRAAESEEDGLDDMMAKGAKGKTAKEEPALTKAQQKKQKKNNGEAAAVEQPKKETKTDKKEAKTDKKVQFAKNLEQGPTPSGDKPTGTLGVKEVRGVKIDDKKLGKGVAAKSGNTVAMRYIGKLEDGKVFDSNKKGKPFTFKLGKGEVIKGWDIGVAGMAPGGERRITIPPQLAYGKKALPGIPGNSKLIFDVKLLEIK
ncbi:FK506-binding protein 4 [Penicillium macrosclerotiorum]|uniref:FK506-binding protein 4 n=1 Tax=Penicillium macrosclerotiorum TaxID=303699 RepID=UPI002549B3C0|nr:FK506-binding protein 4 [Penicillium macrosclerotiorum]KAJ5669479.1 FK506-binding protein 4 [Penicillium macrosclerotiorum]